MYGLAALAEHLDKERPVVVQAHDFPDHDAVATAYALSELLKRSHNLAHARDQEFDFELYV